MKQFKILVQVRFTTKKKTLYTICLTTCRTTSAFISQPPKMVKHNQTIRENIGKILKMDGSRTQLVTSLPSKNKTQVLVVKNYAKTDIKFFFAPSSFALFLDIQKQPHKRVPRKRCSENMQQLYKRTPMPKCDFNKVAK